MASRNQLFIIFYVGCLALLIDKSYSLGKDNAGDNSNSNLVDNSNTNDNQNSDKNKSPDYSIQAYILSGCGGVATLSGVAVLVHCVRKKGGRGSNCCIINVNVNGGAKTWQTDNRQVQFPSLPNTDLGDIPSIEYKSEK
ncbi:uncharacterized protein LOC144626661 [Crassostrea virginica]